MADAPNPPAPPSNDPPAPPDPPAPEPELGDAGKKALDEERRQRRDAEKAAKTAQKALDDLRAATMNDNEKAIAAAKAEGRTEALREAGIRLVDAEVRNATHGRNIDAAALLEGLDRERFLTADGEPDTAAIAAWIERVAPAADPNAVPDLGQGARGQGAQALGSDPLVNDLKSKLGIR